MQFFILQSVINPFSQFELLHQPDPHFRTYDGTRYSYHGQCDLIMARSPLFGDGLGLDLHVRTELAVQGAWSFISNTALRIGEDVFELASKDASCTMNGVLVDTFPTTLAGRYAVNEKKELLNGVQRSIFVVNLEDGEKIVFSTFKQMISVRVEARLESSEGMLGVHGKPGMVGRDHDIALSDPNEMGAQWQVTDVESMLFHEVRSPQYPERCILPSVASRRRLEQYSNEEHQEAKAACANVPEDMYDFCFEDVLRTGDYSLADGYGFAF